MLAEASITRRNSSGAAGSGLDAIAAHVPDCAALRVEIGGDDEELAAQAILFRDRGKHLWGHMLGDQVAQRPGREQAGSEQPANAFKLQEALEGAAGKYTGEHVVIAGAEKSEGRNQRAGAGAGDDGELWPVASLGPAVQKAGAKGAVCAAAGQGQNGRAIACTPQAEDGGASCE